VKVIAIGYQFSSVGFDTEQLAEADYGASGMDWLEEATNMKRIWPIALIGFVLLWYIALFPPRRPQRVEQSHIAVSRAFLFSTEFYLERAEEGSIRAEIDTGRMLSEIVLVVTFFGLVIASLLVPGSRSDARNRDCGSPTEGPQ
jgi:hypothetical protein